MKHKVISIKDKIKKNKYKLLVLLVLLVLIILITYIFIIKSNKKSIDDIIINELETVNILNNENEADAAKLIKENIVKIVNKIDDKESKVGTGFFIKEGYLITNSHIVDIYGDISIEYSDGIKSKAYLYSNSIEYDIALLKVENIQRKALCFGESTLLNVTDDVLAAGYLYNFAGEASITKGVLSARRNVNTLSYLQSDISVDNGSSGGPLFNAKSEVMGINTFVTENKNFAFSISSETIQLFIDLLLDSPTVEYLTDRRPSNNINDILVEIGYTDDENLDLFNDYDIIKKSNDEHKDEIEEMEKEDNITIVDKNNNSDREKIYYCDLGYTLVGKKCVKQISYEAENIAKCKDGYVLKDGMCSKSRIVDAEVKYNCDGELTKEKTCIEKVLWERGFGSYNYRWGSCPKGKKCYDEGIQKHSNTANNIFVSELVCPSGSTKLFPGYKIIGINEEYKESNFKTWNTSLPGAIKKIDKDGLTYYEDVSNILSMCVKSYDEDNHVYTVYTYDELKNVACPNGGTLKTYANNQGFYCQISNSEHWYSWDVTCNDSAYSVMEYNGRLVCGLWQYEEHIIDPIYDCPEGNMRSDRKTCTVIDSYVLEKKYICKDGDTLQDIRCLSNEIIEPKELEP